MQEVTPFSRLDDQIEEMLKADEILAVTTGARRNFQFIEEPWTMLEEPWRCQWFDPLTKSLCEVYTVGSPYPGGKYAMFAVYEEERKVVLNYVFLMDQYHFIDGVSDAPVDD